MSDTLKKTTYHVLDPAAVFIAGERVSAERTVELFEAQSRYPLLAEQISAEKPKVPLKAAPKSIDA